MLFPGNPYKFLSILIFFTVLLSLKNWQCFSFFCPPPPSGTDKLVTSLKILPNILCTEKPIGFIKLGIFFKSCWIGNSQYLKCHRNLFRISISNSGYKAFEWSDSALSAFASLSGDHSDAQSYLSLSSLSLSRLLYEQSLSPKHFPLKSSRILRASSLLRGHLVVFTQVVFTQATEQSSFSNTVILFPHNNRLGFSVHQLQSQVCSQLPSQQVCVLNCCTPYSVWSTVIAILIMCLDYKGCTLAMLVLFQFTSEFTHSGFWVHNLKVPNH